MNNIPLVSFLQSTGFLDAGLAVSVAAEFSWREIPRNEYLLRQGRVSKEYFFLQSGFMRAYARDTAGNEITTAFYGGQQLVFEAASFFTGTESRENIQALADCEGWTLDFDKLNQLFHSTPAFREFGRMVLVRHLAALKNRTLSMITDTAETRYLHLLQTNPQVFQQAPLKFIASYLGITDTSLSRIRKELAKK